MNETLNLKSDSQTFLSTFRGYFNIKDTWTIDIPFVSVVFHYTCTIHQLQSLQRWEQPKEDEQCYHAIKHFLTYYYLFIWPKASRKNSTYFKLCLKLSCQIPKVLLCISIQNHMAAGQKKKKIRENLVQSSEVFAASILSIPFQHV